MIHTKLHKIIETVGHEAAFLENIPHFVVDQSALDMAMRADVQRCIEAMIEADVAHLPLNPMLIEFSVIETARRFVVLSEKAGGFMASVATLYPAALMIGEKPSFVTLEHDQITVTGGAGSDGEAAGVAVAMALLLINTRGISKDVVECGRLNKARVARGQPAIPAYSLLRIGTVYDSDGKGVASGGTRCVAPHLRSGHARQQPYGEGRTLRRYQWIPPVIVNFDPSGPEPRRPLKVVAR